MLEFKITTCKQTGKQMIETSISGKLLLNTPQLNKGTAFTHQERLDFNLLGKLPFAMETLEEQVQRAYLQFCGQDNKLQKHIYLYNLHDKNQVLFYKLVEKHIEELMPVIYTPIVGNAVKEFSNEFRQPRGLYLPYPLHNDIDEILSNRSNPDIDLIVITDGEGILGIGDQGVGGIDIPIAKLMVYTLCAGINPLKTLPIVFDVGTNNQQLLDNPRYLGWRHKRISGKQYDDFVDLCVEKINALFPNVFLHWEDFGRDNAHRHIQHYKNKICTFNDDMQGTGVVTVAAILAAIKATQAKLEDQRIVVYGAGTAGTGISEQILAAFIHEGMEADTAIKNFWLIDKTGLLLNNMSNLTTIQKRFARNPKDIDTWQDINHEYISLENVIANVKPNILIGCSAVSGAFTEDVIKTMARYVAQPIILPLSNPTENAEATPEDITHWSQGRALIASGSPFEPVTYSGKTITIPQCNNALVFPGIGLGIISVKATRLTDEMLWVACKSLAECSPILQSQDGPLLPSLKDAREAAFAIAISVAEQAIKDGVANLIPNVPLSEHIKSQMWEPSYFPFKRI